MTPLAFLVPEELDTFGTLGARMPGYKITKKLLHKGKADLCDHYDQRLIARGVASLDCKGVSLQIGAGNWNIQSQWDAASGVKAQRQDL